MAARKGTQPPGGSRKGVPNKITADIKAMIVGALSAKGGQTYLEKQADANPVAFMGLIGKVLPLQVTGEGGGALVIRWDNADHNDTVSPS
jgi:hypothetical protein